MAKPKKAAVLSLLDRMGAEYTSKITVERAIKKLERYITKKGVPSEVTEDEQVILDIIAGTPKPEEKPATSKKASKKATSKKASSKKSASKKAAKKDTPKKETKPRADWMTCATKAVLSSPNMDKAGEKAASIFRAAGGRETPNTDQNGRLYSSFASKALIEAGVISLDGKIISKL